MATRKRTKHTMPLVVEKHPSDYTGYPFITLIKFRQNHILTIVDNSDEKTISSYVLDSCGPTKVNEESLIAIASEWYKNNRTNYPISIEFSKRGVVDQFAPILQTFNIEFVSRIIGPLPSFNMDQPICVKRRRRKPLPVGVEIKKSNVILL